MLLQHLCPQTLTACVLKRGTSKIVLKRKTVQPFHRTGLFVKAALNPPAGTMAARSLEGFLDRVEECNRMEEPRSEFVPFVVAGCTVGYLSSSFARELERFQEVFVLVKSDSDQVAMGLCEALATPEERTAAVAVAMDILRQEGVISGWRNELYPVMDRFGDEPAFLVERAAAASFGVKTYGVHVNGYVELSDGSVELWVARRSKQKPTWPGKLDHIAAGGQPYGISPQDNVTKECEEEASIPPNLAKRAQPVGVVSYEYSTAAHLKRDVLFCYDLKLPQDFTPSPSDGEVESFMRMPLENVAEIISTSQDFKTNCNLVIIDFMIRHGYISPEQPRYLQLVKALRNGDWS
mmetsp:Transcript_19625/g.37472  ORF Transcript_19625/g.37472 Transcript_19625/m.37472 type:complete len:350 (-) Transcript_19625:257-1306(-)